MNLHNTKESRRITARLIELRKENKAQATIIRDQGGWLAEANAENHRLRELVERTCGDGCHCVKENNGICALDALESNNE
jgi:hypothetical protein